MARFWTGPLHLGGQHRQVHMVAHAKIYEGIRRVGPGAPDPVNPEALSRVLPAHSNPGFLSGLEKP
jgi:hypothetical protein